MTSVFIEIPHWTELRHYRARQPNWIKLHVALLHDERYLRVTGHQRAVFHGICLVYAGTNRHVPASTGYLARRLDLRIARTLEALADAGFIAFRASGDEVLI